MTVARSTGPTDALATNGRGHLAIDGCDAVEPAERFRPPRRETVEDIADRFETPSWLGA